MVLCFFGGQELSLEKDLSQALCLTDSQPLLLVFTLPNENGLRKMQSCQQHNVILLFQPYDCNPMDWNLHY